MIAILSNFLASSRSVGTAATMAGAGIYLHRLGLANDESKKLLAKISQQVTIPALLFTKIVYCKQDSSDEECTSIYDMLGSVWMLLFWPVYVVGCGLLVGYIAARISNTPSHHRPLVLASCAFANSTGLPITLLSVIHQNFPPSTELGKIDATLFLSIYLLMYPVLQWGIGGWLLMTDEKESSYEIEKDQNAIKEETEKHSTKLLVSKSPSSVALGIEYDDLENTTLINTYQEQNTDIVDSTSISTEERPLDFWMQIKKGFEKALQPPVIGSLLGLFVAAIRPLRGVFVDMMNRDDDAYLEWIFDGLYSIGQAAVPINMIILGINLSKTIQTKAGDYDILSPQTTITVILAKMVVMPIIGISSTLFLKYHVWNIPDGIDDAFYLVLMIVFITPTANNVMIMVELGDKVSKEGISRLLGWQYAVAPVLLSLNVSIIVYLVNSSNELNNSY